MIASGTAVDKNVDVVFDIVSLVVIFFVAIEVEAVVEVVFTVTDVERVVRGVFEVDFAFVNAFNCVVDVMGGGVDNVLKPPIALFIPVELLSALIGSLVVIVDPVNISSLLI